MKIKSPTTALYQTAQSLLLGFLSWVLPKESNLLVFYPIHEKRKFSGNLKALALCFAKNYPQYQVCWLTPDAGVARSVELAGLRAKVFSRLPIWTLARARLIFVDSYVKYLCFGDFSVIQAWHGVGYKLVGAINPKNGRFKRALLLLMHRQYKLALASSRVDQLQKIEMFQTPFVEITGSPRNDVLFGSKEEIAQRRASLGLGAFRRVILYAPTYRDVGGKPPFKPEFWSRINASAAATGTVFIIKKHPLENTLIVPPGLSNIFDLSSALDDTQTALLISDVLITDYSSIATDFVLMRRPVLFYMYDAEDYMAKSRDFYFDLFEILPGPIVKDPEQLLSLSLDVHWFTDPEYQQGYNKFIDLFHENKDGLSSERATRAIAQKICRLK